ncbi:MAG: TetR/AcrR family transcriptional regulator [Candidatus Dormibacteraeota bacterium]|uniref:TetR/AcrR family transcriptional regulator n=1 Tax=Candidatus Dormiibacter inghamiae TaxID=3127013 RepID=A0A934NCV9_9BACT|nr:TetR/AcrR family transcriptional regulator [Candidatus Dormibacteraeota bacterium]MBJ7606252.1 TetR/AcrR family transcriptional regulator [Candidatus Dormibacteraeota bacterium]
MARPPPTLAPAAAAQAPAPIRRRTGRLASAAVIMEAATTLFLRKGYAGTSMDEIASLAGVSKQTIYTHFADKERLFSDLILRNAARVDEFVEQVGGILEDSHDLEKALLELARRYIQLVIRPEVLQLRRLVIGEAGNFPELAGTYYQRVPERVLATLATNLEGLAGRGLLRMDDPVLAANHFVALILWVPLDRAMFHIEQESLKPARLEQLADAGVRVFLAAYSIF